MKAWLALAFVAAAGVLPAHAAPPAAGSEDAELLLPYAEWITAQAGPNGVLCCSISDCRVVPQRINAAGHYEALITQKDGRGFEKFLAAPDAWVEVPSEVVKRIANPTGFAIACWSHYRAAASLYNGFFCFFAETLT